MDLMKHLTAIIDQLKETNRLLAIIAKTSVKSN